MPDDLPRLSFRRAFAGRERTFQLRLGEVEELERLCRATIAVILQRLATLQFSVADVREAIRLSLMGGGASEAEATTLVMLHVDTRPLAEALALATDCVTAYVSGLPDVAGGDASAKPVGPGDISPWLEIAGALQLSPADARRATPADLIAMVRGFKRANGGGEDPHSEIGADEALAMQAEQERLGNT